MASRGTGHEPAMKSKRHAKIFELIAEFDIDTQEELLDRLGRSGFKVTQATVSRDIRELRLVKTRAESGGYKYAVDPARGGVNISFKFHAVFSESVDSIDYAENIVVIRCYIGMANAACAALDSIHWDGVVGTLAGDDTIFCVMRTKNDAAAFTEQLKRLLRQA